MIQIVEAIAPLRAWLSTPRRAGRSIGFVPTMGALHEGHASLIQRARADCDVVVVSVFVNPIQFDRRNDLDAYPRTLEEDLAVCRAHGVDVVFAPSVEEMYPTPMACTVDPGRVAQHLCGRYRSGHFAGVATVVLKLFEIVQPDVAYFGQKDAQQLAVVRRLITDFNVPVRLEAVPTVREPDGLALSSRNRRLDASERALAPTLYRALREAESRIASGTADAAAVTRAAAALIPRDDRLRLEYLEVVDERDFQPVERITGPVVVAGALWVGRTRLIDNVRCPPPSHA